MTERWEVRISVVQVPDKPLRRERVIISANKRFWTGRSNSRALQSAVALYRKLLQTGMVDE